MAPELAVADGTLGFWQAIEEVWPKTGGQRCWVHKTANVLKQAAEEPALESQAGAHRKFVRNGPSPHSALQGMSLNKTALAMIFKLAEAAEKSWRRLDGHNQLPKVILGVEFVDGIEVIRPQAQAAA